MDETLHLDFTGVSSGFEPLPVGILRAEVESVERQVSRSSGQPMLAWTFRITEPGLEGRKAFYNTSLQRQALWKLKKALRALGWSSEELSGPLNLDPHDLVGQECALVIAADRDRDGNPVTRVRDLLPADQATGPAQVVEEGGIPDLDGENILF